VMFGLTSAQDLFATDGCIDYSVKLLEAATYPHLTFLECYSQNDVDVATTVYLDERKLGNYLEDVQITFYQELNMTTDDWRFAEIENVLPRDSDAREYSLTKQLNINGVLGLHEGQTFSHFNDQFHHRT